MISRLFISVPELHITARAQVSPPNFVIHAQAPLPVATVAQAAEEGGPVEVPVGSQRARGTRLCRNSSNGARIQVCGHRRGTACALCSSWLRGRLPFVGLSRLLVQSVRSCVTRGHLRQRALAQKRTRRRLFLRWAAQSMVAAQSTVLTLCSCMDAMFSEKSSHGTAATSLNNTLLLQLENNCTSAVDTSDVLVLDVCLVQPSQGNWTRKFSK